jgi:Domain of unknown function (DUF4411)
MAKGQQSTIYSIDSSALIHAWRRAYPPKHFPPFWNRLEALIDSKRMFASNEVLREIKRKDDELQDWSEARPKMFLPITAELQDHVIEVMRKYPRLVDTSKGRSAADPFVVSLARLNNPKWTVVSEENPGRVCGFR